MPVPTKMSDLPTLASSNSPAGTEAIGNSLDDYIRSHGAIIRSTNAIASATIAAAATTDVATADGESVQITGSATITSLGTGFNGCRRELRFTAACTLTNSANLVLPNGNNVVTTAGDNYLFRCFGSGQWVLIASSRPRADGISGVTTYMAGVLGSADAATARSALGAQASLGFTPVNKAGDTMTGSLGMTVNSGSVTLESAGAVNGWQFLSNISDAVNLGLAVNKKVAGVWTKYFDFEDDGEFTLSQPDLKLGYHPTFGSAYRGLMRPGTSSFIVMYGTAGDPQTYVTSPAGGSVIIRADNNNTAASFTVATTGSTLNVPLTLGGGRKLTSIQLSTSAPGALSDGVLYLQY